MNPFRFVGRPRPAGPLANASLAQAALARASFAPAAYARAALAGGLFCLSTGAAWSQNLSGDDTAAANPALSAPLDPLDALSTEAPRRSWWMKALDAVGLSPGPEKRAEKAYRSGEYDAALAGYGEALLDHPDAAGLHYNAGAAHYRKRDYEGAIAAYGKALESADGPLRGKVQYNLGNAYFRRGEAALRSGKQEGLSDYREALAHYKKALDARPDHTDTKRNIEVVQARIKELLEQQEQDQQQQQQQQDSEPPPPPSDHAQEVWARALQLTKQRRYAEAQSLLESLFQEDATGENYRAHEQRLEDIGKILRGEKPSRPKPGDNRAQAGGVGVI